MNELHEVDVEFKLKKLAWNDWMVCMVEGKLRIQNFLVCDRGWIYLCLVDHVGNVVVKCFWMIIPVFNILEKVFDFKINKKKLLSFIEFCIVHCSGFVLLKPKKEQ